MPATTRSWSAVPATGRTRIRWPGSILILGLCLAAGRGEATGPDPDDTSLTRRNLESFDQVWRTIRDRHFDPTFGGLDWDAVGQELRPRAEGAASREEARAVLKEMVGRLRLSHLNIIPAELYDSVDNGQPVDAEGVTGIDLRVLDGRALVTSVRAGSPADSTGVLAGWEIARVGDMEIPPLLAQLADEYQGQSWHDLILSSVVIDRLRGRTGDTVTVEFLDGSDRRVTHAIRLARPDGRTVRLGHLPPGHVTFSTRTLEDGIGYITFNLFIDPATLMPAFNQAMTSFAGAPGIILDLRGNGGGIGEMGLGMAGWFIEQPGLSFGTARLRDCQYTLTVQPRPAVHRGPLAVLVDGLSISAAEFMAAGLQESGRARVFGSPSAGAALPSSMERLPNGDGFQYVHADFVTPSGRRLEQHGVHPDELVRPNRESLLAGRDPACEAAVRWIRAQP